MIIGINQVLFVACLAIFYPAHVEGAALAAENPGYAIIKDLFLALRPIRGVPAWIQPDPGPLVRHGTCECHNNTCGCCSVFVVQQFLFKQQGCLNFTYNATEYAVTMNLFLGNFSIFDATLSGRNPPPLCIPVPQLPIIAICITLYDIHTEGDDFYMCLNLELRLQGISLFVVSFDCLKFGPDGLALVKPKQTRMKSKFFPLISLKLSKPDSKNVTNSTMSRTKSINAFIDLNKNSTIITT